MCIFIERERFPSNNKIKSGLPIAMLGGSWPKTKSALSDELDLLCPNVLDLRSFSYVDKKKVKR